MISLLVKNNKKIINLYYHYSKLCNRNSYWNKCVDYVSKRNRCITSLTGQRRNGYLSYTTYILPLSIKKLYQTVFTAGFPLFSTVCFWTCVQLTWFLQVLNIVCFNELLNTKITLKISTINRISKLTLEYTKNTSDIAKTDYRGTRTNLAIHVSFRFFLHLHHRY